MAGKAAAAYMAGKAAGGLAFHVDFRVVQPEVSATNCYKYAKRTEKWFQG
jgi:hypothetical protein